MDKPKNWTQLFLQFQETEEFKIQGVVLLYPEFILWINKTYPEGIVFDDSVGDGWIPLNINPDFQPLKNGETVKQTENLLLTDGISVTIGFASQSENQKTPDWKAYGNPYFEPTHYKKYLPLPTKTDI